MLIEWSDDYLIGIEKIDGQHKGFFAAAHRLGWLLAPRLVRCVRSVVMRARGHGLGVVYC